MTLRPFVGVCMLAMTLVAVAHAAPHVRAPNGGGGGDPPDIELSTTSLPFGDVHLGGSPIQSFVVSNVGVEGLSVSLAFTGTGASKFLLIDPLGPFDVSPGLQVEVILTFYPTSIGVHEATLEVHSNDPVDPLLTVSLSGNGYEANLVSMTGTPDPVSINGSMSFTVVLDSPAGPGDVGVEISTSPTALIVVPLQATVLQGETQAQFDATAGPVAGTETVYANLHSMSVSDEIEIQNTVGVDAASVRALWLGPVVPNPVRRTSRVAFALPSSARVRLEVFDLMGRTVATLAEGIFPAGRHEVPWNPIATRTGMYLVRLGSLGETRIVKAVVTP